MAVGAVAVVTLTGALIGSFGALGASGGSLATGQEVSLSSHGSNCDRHLWCHVFDHLSPSTSSPSSTATPAAPTTTTTSPPVTVPATTTPASTTPASTPPATTTPATTTPTAGTSTTGASTSAWWTPPANVEWQWEIDHPLVLTSASDMGTGVTSFLGTPAANPTVYDIDGFDNTAATVSALHAAGDHAICYIEVGAAENYRPDYSSFPAADLGATMQGYSAERYLNINDPAVLQVIEARVAMCHSKGFDAVEPDIDDSYTDSTGFSITEAQNVTYDATLAAYAHSLGMGWALKNGDDASFAAALQPTSDFVLDEQCHEYDTCASFAPFAAAGKAVLEVEYDIPTSQFCTAANAANEDAMEMNVNLNGGRQPCR